MLTSIFIIANEFSVLIETIKALHFILLAITFTCTSKHLSVKTYSFSRIDDCE